MSQIFKLYRLQQLDSQLDKAQARLREIEAALGQNETLRQAQQHAQEASASLQAAREALRRTEDGVRDQRIKIEQSESTLYSGKVHNPKELQDLQNEIAALKRFRSVLEDRQLEAMIVMEEVEASHQAAEAEVAAVQAQLVQQNSSLVGEQSGLLNEVAHLENERQATAGTISEEDLKLYNLLRQQRRGVAVAKVNNKSCSACGSTLNSVLLHAAHSPNQIARCDTCGRILYAL
ncbi:MAG TPA: hypothetical protein VF498_19330 [Anaerolineales bacterium]